MDVSGEVVTTETAAARYVGGHAIEVALVRSQVDPASGVPGQLLRPGTPTVSPH